MSGTDKQIQARVLKQNFTLLAGLRYEVRSGRMGYSPWWLKGEVSEHMIPWSVAYRVIAMDFAAQMVERWTDDQLGGKAMQKFDDAMGEGRAEDAIEVLHDLLCQE